MRNRASRNGAGKSARACGAVSAFVIGLIATAGPVYADDTDDVVARPRPEYDAKGLPLGAFRLFPSLKLAASIDDNVERKDTGTLSDIFFTISSSAALHSEWSQHALNFSASSDTFVYSKYSSENVTNFSFGGDGRLDVLRSFRVAAGANFANLHVLRSSPDLPANATEPLPYSQTHADVSAEYKPEQFGVAIGVGFDRFHYSSLEVLGGGSISWNDQNHDLYLPYARAFYEFSPGYTAYAEAAYDDREFDLAVDRSGFERSSHGYRVRGGLGLLLGHLVHGQAFLGYLDQQFAAPLPNVSGLDFGASLDWYATQLTTVRFSAARAVNDTTFAGASARDDRTVRISVDHELLRNLILHANAGYTDSQFRGIPRDDKVADVGFGAGYLMNRYLSLEAKYTYQSRNSNALGQDYSDNLFSIGVTGHL